MINSKQVYCLICGRGLSDLVKEDPFQLLVPPCPECIRVARARAAQDADEAGYRDGYQAAVDEVMDKATKFYDELQETLYDAKWQEGEVHSSDSADEAE